MIKIFGLSWLVRAAKYGTEIDHGDESGRFRHCYHAGWSNHSAVVGAQFVEHGQGCGFDFQRGPVQQSMYSLL
jgi:hypothetical protein